MTRVSVRILVSGRVQGVSFRAIMKEKALRHRVNGWVKNRPDGSVEALLQGEDAAVGKIVQWAKLGPPRAAVSSLKEEKLTTHPPQVGFRILD